jgi:hydrogenase expression/formation protein HypC
MRVVESQPGFALCEVDGELRRIDTLLVGEPPVGAWLLTFLDTAREVLREEHAIQIRDALQALQQVMRGDGFPEYLFQDLLEREPELPAFLQDAATERPTGE